MMTRCLHKGWELFFIYLIFFNFWPKAYLAKETDMQSATKILEGTAVLLVHVLEIVDIAMILAARSTPVP